MKHETLQQLFDLATDVVMYRDHGDKVFASDKKPMTGWHIIKTWMTICGSRPMSPENIERLIKGRTFIFTDKMFFIFDIATHAHVAARIMANGGASVMAHTTLT